MDDEHQVEIPESFCDLYRVPGRLKPTEPRAVVGARYELCEDLAQHLREYARAQHFDLGISEDEVLQRCHRGLLSEGSAVGAAEALWVTRRLAELLEWGGAEWSPSES